MLAGKTAAIRALLSAEWRAIRTIWPFLRSSPLVVVLTAVLLVLRIASQLAMPLFAASHLDSTLQQGAFHRLPGLVGALAAIGFLSAGISMLQRYLGALENLKMTNRAKQAVLAQVLRGPLDVVAGRSGHYWQSRIERDVAAITPLFLHNILLRASSVVQMVALGTLMALIDFRMLLLALGLGAVGVAARLLLGRYRRKVEFVISELAAANSSAVADVLNALPFVKLSVAEEREEGSLAERYRTTQVEETRIARVRALTDLAGVVTRALVPVGIYAYGMLLLNRGELSTGKFAGFAMLGAMLAGAMRSAFGTYDKLDGAFTGAGRVAELMTGKTESVAVGRARGRERIGTIEFQDVHFSYEPPDEWLPRRRWSTQDQVRQPKESRGGKQQVLRGVNLILSRGEPCVLVGQSGVGKSTLVRLLCGYYQPTQGRILVDGADLRELDVAEYRRKLSVVTHEDYLLERPFWENVCYRSDQLRAPEAEELVRMLGLEQVARREPRSSRRRLASPEGFGKRVSELLERGARPAVSAGERQRIALARQLLHDADTWILDEATSNLDAALEGRVLDLVFARQPMILLGISHRLSFVKRFSRVHVLVEGRITASGSPRQLLESCQEFQTLYGPQLIPAAPRAELPAVEAHYR